ncbi:hypothetical protein W97_05728 [Coniosporium apollinis CBS 100218]|uniref:Aquaporin rerated protein, other eukaryote n=1 Tax=Coniosporium apollinis (strain CBS 100218) TaxID=1168221 RepID=R7YWM2_CONA1|nr:uncharacterized protein W97_05728 [Coniosporium apollinis CBS 100218]EON66335.1 hypothetical protein W97_05728 [Coniosporium apollinis CBS 100218]
MNIGRPADNIVLPFMRARTGDPNHPAERRLRGFGWLPNKVRNHFIAMMGEFVGTFLFLFFAFAGTQVANTAAAGASTEGGELAQVPNASVLMYISLAFGFSLAVNAWVFFRISGGLFNPAVTLGMCLIGAVGWVRGALVFISQILGAISAAGIVSCLFPGPLAVRTSLGGGTSIVRGLFIEMFLTAMLVFTIFMLAAEKHKGTFLAPIGIGLALFIAELAGVWFTGGSLNPARSFGPNVILGTFEGYHWIYWAGPALGSIVAVVFYRLIKVLEYETANPGQDFNEKEAEVFNPDEEPATAADVRRPNVGVGASEYIATEEGIQPVTSITTASSDGGELTKYPSKGRGGHDGTSEDLGRSRSNRNSAVYGQPRPAHTGRSSGDHRRSRGGSGSGTKPSYDGYADAARAAYPPGGSSHNHFPHDRGYYNGPDAENGTMYQPSRV